MNHPALRHPGRWLWLLLLVPVLLGLARLRFDVEIFDLLPGDLPVVQGLKLFQEHFANARQLLITINAPEAEQATASARVVAETLRSHHDLVTSVTWEPPWEEDPLLSAELIAYLWFNQPPAVFGQLTNRLAHEQMAAHLAAAREELATSLSPGEMARLSFDPLGLTRLPESTRHVAPAFGEGQDLFSSPDGRFRIMFIEAARDLRSYRECSAWLKAVQQVVHAALPVTPSVTLRYTGRPAFVTEIARGMERDMTTSVIGTAAIIAALFYLAHKRIKPMLWLLTLLTIILGSTLALGGLIFGNINVVSMGFAAILLGLAVDYAVVHYQEALAQPQLSIPEVRHAIAPSIFWAAVTTISAFLVLNLGGLPGLAQLGTLVGLGVGLSALIMIFEFLPPLFPERQGDSADGATAQISAAASATSTPLTPRRKTFVFGATVAVFLAAAVVLISGGLPSMDPTADALRPRHSSAYAALDQIQANLTQDKEPLWLLVAGSTVGEVAERLSQLDSVLQRAVERHDLAGFNLPTPLWPRPEFQNQNRGTAAVLAQKGPDVRQAAQAGGFAERSIALTAGMLKTWQRAASSEGIVWPTNRMSQWIFDKFAAHSTNRYFALGLLTPLTRGAEMDRQLSTLADELPHDNVWLSGWELLGRSIFTRVKANLWKLVVPMLVLVMLSLWLAFGRPREILLSLGGLALSGICLLALMRLFGWSWNLLNLMALPLVLGTGVDYSIFMQLALRRHGGDLRMAHQAVGRALWLCGGTAVAGFGSLAWSSNAGMAGLGRVCALGIASNTLIAILLLPTWWRSVSR